MYIAQLEKEMTALKKKETENEARIAEMEKKTASHTVRIKEIDAELEKHKREIDLKLKLREMEHREKQREKQNEIERYKAQQAEFNMKIVMIINDLSQPSSRARTPEGHDESMRSNGSDDRIGFSYYGMENTPSESPVFF